MEDDMSISFLPKLIAPSITAITPALLNRRGIRLLMLDFDNTIVTYYSDIPTPQVEAWFQTMQVSGILLCVVSNSKSDRVQCFCDARGLDCIIRAEKPRGKGIRECLARYQIPASQAALVGDQIFTDTLGANAQGVTSILVKAIHNHTIFFKCRHVLELPFIAMAWKRKIEHE